MTSLFERVSYRNTHLCTRIPLKLPHTMILGSCKNSQNYWSGSIKLFDRLIRVDDVSGDGTEYLLAIRKIVEILAIKRKTIMIHQTLREEYRNEYRKIQTRKKNRIWTLFTLSKTFLNNQIKVKDITLWN